jgi:SAM-dependent methyltransferase
VDSTAWDERYAAGDLLWSAGPNQFVAAELARLKPGRALDLAAGEGRNALWLADRGWRVVAVDFSRVALEKGRAVEERRPGGVPVDWVHADALSYSGQGFDLVVIAYLQLPEEQRRTAVRRAFTALREGGTFFLVAHDASNLSEGTGGPQDPAVQCTAEEVLAHLHGQRFEVERAERVGRVVESDDGHGATAQQTAYDTLVRLVRTG